MNTSNGKRRCGLHDMHGAKDLNRRSTSKSSLPPTLRRWCMGDGRGGATAGTARIAEKATKLFSVQLLPARILSAPTAAREWTVTVMPRLIDADEALRSLPDDLPYKDSVRRVLIQAPTVDAVRVTRCVDCESARELTQHENLGEPKEENDG